MKLTRLAESLVVNDGAEMAVKPMEKASQQLRESNQTLSKPFMQEPKPLVVEAFLELPSPSQVLSSKRFEEGSLFCRRAQPWASCRLHLPC
jgi:hypothetical protein